MALKPTDAVAWVGFTFLTGDDDLHADSDVWAAVVHRNGRGTATAPLSDGNVWPARSRIYARVRLGGDVHVSDLERLEVHFSWNGEDWSMEGLEIWVKADVGDWKSVYAGRGAPLCRFSGSVTSFAVEVCPPDAVRAQ